MTIPELYKIYQQHPKVFTDSRLLKPNAIFFALKGDNFNGNQFALKALEGGAAYAVVDEDLHAKDERIIRVPDVLTTLQQLAKHHRQQFGIPFIAITGSNGKTTTKELLHAVLQTSFKTYTTKGNLNNHIGIPITLLEIGSDAEMAVIEMGANHRHEIEGYCKYAMPTHGLITNCGKAHLEGFGGEEGVRKGKGELLQYLASRKGVAFAFDDYDYMHQMVADVEKVIWYGTEKGFITGATIKNEPFLSVEIRDTTQSFIINTQLVGSYNLPNVLAAVAVGKYFDVSNQKITSAIASYSPSNSRSQLMDWNGNKLILDAYNANPTSMRAAIENMAAIKGDSKVLMLGAMMELGDESVKEHQEIVELIAKHSWKEVALVGGDFLKITHPYLSFRNAAEAAEWFKRKGFQNHYILIKGSRSMKMEQVLS